MLETVLVILLLCWLLGAFVVPIGGNLIHVLVVIFVVLLIVRLLRGQSVL